MHKSNAIHAAITEILGTAADDKVRVNVAADRLLDYLLDTYDVREKAVIGSVRVLPMHSDRPAVDHPDAVDFVMREGYLLLLNCPAGEQDDENVIAAYAEHTWQSVARVPSANKQAEAPKRIGDA